MREAFAKNIGLFEILTFEILTMSLVLNNRALQVSNNSVHIDNHQQSHTEEETFEDRLLMHTRNRKGLSTVAC